MATTSQIAEKVLLARAYYIELLDEYLVHLQGGGNCESHFRKLVCLKRLIKGLQWDLASGINNDTTTKVYEKLILELADYDGTTSLPVNPNVVIPNITIVAGIAGPKGDPGADGLSAYLLAVQEGFVGTLQQWLDSLKASDRPYIDDLIAQQTLQVVTDKGNITTNDIILDQSKITFIVPTEPIKTKFVGGNYLMSITRDSDGYIYGMAYGNSVVKISPDLSTMETILSAGVGINPFGSAANGLAMDADKNLYVSDYLGYRILKFAPGSTTGVIVAGGNGQGSGLNQLNNARGTAIGPDGKLYVADAGNNRVLKYEQGSPIGTVVIQGSAGSGLNQFNGLDDLAFDPQGRILIADSFNHRVIRWEIGGTAGVVVAGGNGSGSGLNQLSGPRGVSLDEEGVIYVSDTANSRIVRWVIGASSGEVVAGGIGQSSAENGLKLPYDVIVDPIGKYIYIADTFNYRVVAVYTGASQIDLEAITGDLYENGKRILTEDDLFDPSGLATSVEVSTADLILQEEIDNIENVLLPNKVDKTAGMLAGRVIFVDTDGTLTGQGNFSFDKTSGQLKVNTTASNSNYKMLLGGGLSVMSGAINMDEYQSVLYMSGGRCALIVDGNGIQYRLFNNDNADFPDTSKSFIFRNKAFVHFKCYTIPLALDGSGNPSAWEQINEFQKFVRMPDIGTSLGSYQTLVLNNSSKRVERVAIDVGTITPAWIQSLPIIDDGDTTGLVEYEPYRTSAGDLKYKLPAGTSPWSSAFDSTFGG